MPASSLTELTELPVLNEVPFILSLTRTEWRLILVKLSGRIFSCASLHHMLISVPLWGHDYQNCNYSFVIRIHSYLTGVISVLATVRQFNDLGHPLCRNLRDGDWLMDYTVSRLLPFVGTRQVSTHWAWLVPSRLRAITLHEHGEIGISALPRQ